MFRFRLLYRIGIVSSLTLLALAGSVSEVQTITSSETSPEQIVSPSTPVFGIPVQRERRNINSQLLTQRQQPKIALVIGNSAYPEDALSNSRNDATDIANALRSLGFEVTLLLDLDLRAMDDAIEEFNRRLQQGGVGVFYYAGHGVQVEGENYLIPLDASLARQNDVRYETLPLGKVLNAMEDSESQVNVIIIDACRDNPFYRRWRSSNRSLSPERGLALTVPPEGTIISFATAPDDIAADGEGRNSPYTASLLQHIKTENLDIAQMFRQVRADVIRQTNEAQIPWYQESLIGFFSFNPTAETATPAILPLPRNNSSMPVPPPIIPQEDTMPVPPPGSPPPQEDSFVPSTERTLISATTGVNYQPLRDALAAEDFGEADQITRSLMLQAVDRQEDWSSILEYATNFPCDDLRIIDQLWLNHSDGKFGFSIQQEIYQSLSGTIEYNEQIWEDFGDRIGWRVDSSWIDYEDLTLNTSAPRGHLPALGRRFPPNVFAPEKDVPEDIGELIWFGFKGVVYLIPLLERRVNCSSNSSSHS